MLFWKIFIFQCQFGAYIYIYPTFSRKDNILFFTKMVIPIFDGFPNLWCMFDKNQYFSRITRKIFKNPRRPFVVLLRKINDLHLIDIIPPNRIELVAILYIDPMKNKLGKVWECSKSWGDAVKFLTDFESKATTSRRINWS